MNLLKKYKLFGLSIFLVGALTVNTDAQLLVESHKATIQSASGEEISLLPAYNSAQGVTGTYYYLPFGYRLSVKKDGTPEFSFMTYTDGGTSVSGGLMHILLTWGPQLKEEATLNEKLKSKVDSLGFLAGSAMVEHEAGIEKVEIISDHPVADILRRSLGSAAPLPLFPYGKQALSFRFSAEDAETMLEALEDPDDLEPVMFRVHFVYSIMEKDGFMNKRATRTLSLDCSLADVLQTVMASSSDLIKSID